MKNAENSLRTISGSSSVRLIGKLDRTNLAVIVVIILFLAFLLIFGKAFHVIEVVGSAEGDGYVGKAEVIINGDIPRDVYHPLLYPIMAAAASLMTGDAFSGARLISSLSAALCLWFVFQICSRILDGKFGLLVVVLLILNINFITLGINTTTDMMFTMFSMMTMYFLIIVADGAGSPAMVAAGVSFALSVFTRYSGMFILPVIIVVLIRIFRNDGPIRMFQKTTAFVVAASCSLLPHAVLTYKVFGRPFYSESWKNLAFKLYGNSDWTYFDRVPFDGFFSVAMASPEKIVVSTFMELARFFSSTMYYLGGKHLAGTIVSFTFIFGIFLIVRKRSHNFSPVLIFLFSYVILSCIFFLSGVRFMLPVLPVVLITSSFFIINRPGKERPGPRWKLSRVQLVVLSLLVIASVFSVVLHIPRYVRSHPYEELSAAVDLETKYKSNIIICGTTATLGRYIGCKYIYLEDRGSGSPGNDGKYYYYLEDVLIRNKVDYFITGRLSLEQRPTGLIEGRDLPPYLYPETVDEYVAVYRVIWPR